MNVSIKQRKRKNHMGENKHMDDRIDITESKTTSERKICFGDADYPTAFEHMHRPPKTLYVRGRLPDGKRPCVAIVGARSCSGYGRKMAHDFAYELAWQGVQIVSGMAYGVDSLAQKGALDAGGDTFAILGSGTDVCYPEENRDLYERLLTCGGIISEYPKGTKPLARNFPIRNRLISALADIVLVIEAREKSGSLITVDFALEQGKDVYALPGRITDPQSAGCNRLIRQGAGVALSPEDILEALSAKWGIWPRKGQSAAKECGETDAASTGCLANNCPDRPISSTSRKADNCPGRPADGCPSRPAISAAPLTPHQALVLKAMDNRPLSLPQIYGNVSSFFPKDDFTLPEVTEILMELAIAGYVRSLPAGRFEAISQGKERLH